MQEYAVTVSGLSSYSLHISGCFVFRDYGLVPIAAEDYGDMTHSYKVVAAARKNDLRMTLFNLKSK